MQYDIRMLAASGELRRCLANDTKGYNSGLEPNSSFTWLQTESPLWFSLPYFENCFFPFVRKFKFQYPCMHYVCSIFLVRKLAGPFPEAQLLFKGKQRGFWR